MVCLGVRPKPVPSSPKTDPHEELSFVHVLHMSTRKSGKSERKSAYSSSSRQRATSLLLIIINGVCASSVQIKKGTQIQITVRAFSRLCVQKSGVSGIWRYEDSRRSSIGSKLWRLLWCHLRTIKRRKNRRSIETHRIQIFNLDQVCTIASLLPPRILFFFNAFFCSATLMLLSLRGYEWQSVNLWFVSASDYGASVNRAEIEADQALDCRRWIPIATAEWRSLQSEAFMDAKWRRRRRNSAERRRRKQM